MGIFSRKKSNTGSICEKVSSLFETVKDIFKKMPDAGILMVYDDGKNGLLTMEGDMERIKYALSYAAKENSDVSRVLLEVAQNLVKDKILNDPKAPQKIKDIISKVSGKGGKPEKVRLPDGKEGIIIDRNKIDELSDIDIDKMVDEMINTKGKSS